MPLAPTASSAQAARALRDLKLAAIQTLVDHLTRYPEMYRAGLAELLGIARERLSRLMNKEVELFSLDALARIAARASMSVHLRIARPYRRR